MSDCGSMPVNNNDSEEGDDSDDGDCNFTTTDTIIWWSVLRVFGSCACKG